VSALHRPLIDYWSTLRMSETDAMRKRVAARDTLATRTRWLTGAVLAVSAALSGAFAGIAAASAPGHKLLSGTTASRAPGRVATSARTAIPPLPAPPGPGNASAAPPPAPNPAPAPAVTQAPAAVVSGSS
jgi:hypothetical protein